LQDALTVVYQWKSSRFKQYGYC